jgi:hypothetical protein
MERRDEGGSVMVHSAGLLQAVEDTGAKLSYNAIFRQETGEEAVVLVEGPLDDVISRYEEWSFCGLEAVRNAAFQEWEEACREYQFWLDTKDLTDEELDAYLDGMNDCYEYDYY